MTFRN
ncbi:hypothetical protein CP8484711_0838A, partial [Chlamydia psittaci 84-8471/1]